MDLLREINEAEAKKVERKIIKVYKQAQKEVQEKLDDYLASFANDDRIMYEKLLDGKISADGYFGWRRQQMMVGKRWTDLRDKLADRLTNANEEAMIMVGAELPKICAESVNYTMFSAENGSGMRTSFTLWDENTVHRLIQEEPTLLPKPRVKIAKDKRWNKKLITSAVTQGLLQGESMHGIATRMMGEVGKGFSADMIKNANNMTAKQISRELTRRIRNASIRTARTAVTGAENAGRDVGYQEAKKNGIELKQQWLATLDGRTRHEHRQLDGQIREVGEPFEIDGQKLRFPADPQALPRLVYNCRCTTIAVVNGHAIDLSVRDQSKIGNDYDAWKNVKKEEETQKQSKDTDDDLPTLGKLKDTLGDDYKEYYNIINNNEYVKSAYRDYADEVAYYRKTKNGGEYSRGGGIEWSLNDGARKYETLAHEFGHAVDSCAKADIQATYGEIEALHGAHRTFKVIFPRTPSSSDEYLEAMAKDKPLIRAMIDNEEERAIVRNDDLSVGVQDFADGLYNARKNRIFRWGHGAAYYNRTYNGVVSLKAEKALQQAYKDLGFDASNQAKVKRIARRYETASELWANQMAALTTGGKALEYMEKYAPNTLAILKKMLKERKHG